MSISIKGKTISNTTLCYSEFLVMRCFSVSTRTYFFLSPFMFFVPPAIFGKTIYRYQLIKLFCSPTSLTNCLFLHKLISLMICWWESRSPFYLLQLAFYCSGISQKKVRVGRHMPLPTIRCLVLPSTNHSLLIPHWDGEAVGICRG